MLWKNDAVNNYLVVSKPRLSVPGFISQLRSLGSRLIMWSMRVQKLVTFPMFCLIWWLVKHCYYYVTILWDGISYCHHIFMPWSNWIIIWLIMINIPWTLKTAGALNSVDRTESRMVSSHTTDVLLYSSLAGMCRKTSSSILLGCYIWCVQLCQQ